MTFTPKWTSVDGDELHYCIQNGEVIGRKVSSKSINNNKKKNQHEKIPPNPPTCSSNNNKNKQQNKTKLKTQTKNVTVRQPPQKKSILDFRDHHASTFLAPWAIDSLASKQNPNFTWWWWWWWWWCFVMAHNLGEIASPPAAGTSLAPGFRFHPTDEELVQYYLKRKACGKPFRFEAVSEIDVYKSEPWELSGPALSLCIDR